MTSIFVNARPKRNTDPDASGSPPSCKVLNRVTTIKDLVRGGHFAESTPPYIEKEVFIYDEPVICWLQVYDKHCYKVG